MASSPPPPTDSEAGPLDRLQRAVAGWVGPVVYALPILEVWLLSRMSDHGASVLLVALQVGWAACLVTVLIICARRSRVPEAGPAPEQVPEPAERPAAPRRPRPVPSRTRPPAARRRGDH
jgi:hypothetical protein